MKVVAVIAQKGGAGKTTLSLNLAIVAELDGKSTAIIDIDPQASSAKWGDYRDKDAPVITSAQSARLPHVLKAAKEAGAKLVFIDTAPHAEKAALDAAKIADFVLIPSKAALLDIFAIEASVDIVRLAKAKAAIILNAVPPRGKLEVEARMALENYSLNVAPIVIHYRAAFYNAAIAGLGVVEYEPSGKAADEINELYRYTCNNVYRCK